MTNIEYTSLVIEDELLDHLATSEGAMAIYRERFDPILVSDEEVKKVLVFVLNHIHKERKPPTRELLEYEFSLMFREPKAPVGYIVEEFRKRYKLNQGKKAAKAAGRAILEDPDEGIKFAFAEFNRIQNETKSRREESSTKELHTVVEGYRKRRELQGKNSVTMGYKEMDDDLGGFRKDTLSIIAARPKRFKSWQEVKPAVEAWYKGMNPFIATLEMSVEEMKNRVGCMMAAVDYGAFMRGDLMLDQEKRMKEFIAQVEESDNKIRFVRPPRGQRTMDHLLQYAFEDECDIMFIDQLSWMESGRNVSMDLRHREIGYIVEDMKDASKYFPIVCAAQFNREAANLSEMADLSKLGLSDAIGQTADLVLGIYASKEMLRNKQIQYGVVDSRSTPIEIYNIGVRMQYSNFELLSRVSDPVEEAPKPRRRKPGETEQELAEEDAAQGDE